MKAAMEVEKVADMVADILKTKYIKPEMFKKKCIGQKLFDAKCTRLACLLSFASLISSLSSLSRYAWPVAD